MSRKRKFRMGGKHGTEAGAPAAAARPGDSDVIDADDALNGDAGMEEGGDADADEHDDDDVGDIEISADDDDEIEILGYSAADEAGVRLVEPEKEVDLSDFMDDPPPQARAPVASSAVVQGLEQQVKDLQGQLLRNAADFDNFRKRTERDRSEERRQAAAGLVRSLLPVLDSFRRALAQGQAGEATGVAGFLEGFRLIQAQLSDILAASGLEEVDASGRFDPNVHEALMQDPDSKLPHLSVVDVFEPGYRLGGRLLRPARVKVSWKPQEADTTRLGEEGSDDATPRGQG